MNNRTFTKFERHNNSTNEKVSAEHINKLQEVSNHIENNISNIKDELFVDKALFELDNCLYANSIFIDNLDTLAIIDMSKSLNIKYNSNFQSIELEDPTKEGTLYTTKINSNLGDGKYLNDFFLLSDQHVPAGGKITYYIVDSDGGNFPINANSLKSPLSFINNIGNIKIKAVISPSITLESPKLNGIALMFHDALVESKYGLLYPDLSRYTSTTIGVTTLIRDKALGDKLVKVEEPTQETRLTYDNERLTVVETENTEENILLTEELNYGPYENSNNEIEDVLLSITTTQKEII